MSAAPMNSTISAENVGMSRACDHVDDIFVLRQNVRQRLNHVFDSLIRRQQAEREQHRFSFHAEAVLIEIGIQKRQVGHAMRNHVDLAAGYFEDLLQQLGGQLAHHDKTIRKLSDLFHHDSLFRTGLAKNSVESSDDWHFDPAQQTQNVAASRAAKDSILVL